MLKWFDERIDIWLASAPAIGLTVEAVTAFQTDLSKADDAVTSMFAKRNAALAATTAANALSDSVRSTGGALINTIKAFAEATGNEEVYQTALVPPPKKRAPLPPPAMPTNVRGVMRNDGTIELRWDASLANGTVFTVYRSVTGASGATPFVSIGTIGAKTLIDADLPGCIASATYQVKAVRGTDESGFSPAYTFRFQPSEEELAAMAAAQGEAEAA
jgi:hypothetical protein